MGTVESNASESDQSSASASKATHGVAGKAQGAPRANKSTQEEMEGQKNGKIALTLPPLELSNPHLLAHPHQHHAICWEKNRSTAFSPAGSSSWCPYAGSRVPRGALLLPPGGCY